MDKGEVKESGCRGYSNGRSTLCHARGSVGSSRDLCVGRHGGSRGPPTTSPRRPANSNITEPKTTEWTTEPPSVSDPIGTPHPIVEEPQTPGLGMYRMTESGLSASRRAHQAFFCCCKRNDWIVHALGLLVYGCVCSLSLVTTVIGSLVSIFIVP